MTASGSNDSCQDELAQLGFRPARKSVGSVGSGRGSQLYSEKGVPGTEREEPCLRAPAAHGGFPVSGLGSWRRRRRRDR